MTLSPSRPETDIRLLNPSFIDWLHECAENKDFIKEFDRLTDSNLSLRGSPIEIAIDNATGKLKHDLDKLVDFAWNAFERLQP